MADIETCIAVKGLSKKFSRSLKRSFVYGVRDLLGAMRGVSGSVGLAIDEFWAVRDVSFDLPRGSSLGIIGMNGSGKTTLLRMISGILRPTMGTINVQGKIAPMLALGAGFKPVLSGRENIFLNLTLLGLSQTEIRAKYHEIVDFAELEESIGAPLGTYSSGMQARLGFACAVHTNPSLLIVDEVLSVGDTQFRMKCRNRINELRRQGASLLLVSHSALLIEALCDRCLYLRKGEVHGLGVPKQMLARYEQDAIQSIQQRNAHAVPSHDLTATSTEAAGMRPATSSSEYVKIRAVAATVPSTTSETEKATWICGRPAQIRLTCCVNEAVSDLSVNIMIYDLAHQSGEVVQIWSSASEQGWLSLAAGNSEIAISMPWMGLRPGPYRMKISLSRSVLHDLLVVLNDIRVMVRDDGLAGHGTYVQPRAWTVMGGVFSNQRAVDTNDDVDA